MNRSGNYRVINIVGEPRYNSFLLHKIINKTMLHGRKQKAANIVYKVLERLKEYCVKNNRKDDDNVLSEMHIIETVINKIQPKVFLRKKDIASKTIMVPISISENSAIKRAIAWLVQGSRLRTTEKKFEDKLFAEIIEVYEEEKGESIKKRNNYHRIAKDNEAFVHYV